MIVGFKKSVPEGSKTTRAFYSEIFKGTPLNVLSDEQMLADVTGLADGTLTSTAEPTVRSADSAAPYSAAAKGSASLDAADIQSEAAAVSERGTRGTKRSSAAAEEADLDAEEDAHRSKKRRLR